MIASMKMMVIARTQIWGVAQNLLGKCLFLLRS